MKAVILNTEKKHTNILCKDGSFKKVRRESWHVIGKEFNYVSPARTMISKAAIFLVAISAVSSGIAYALPYRTLAFDINPSITMSINRFGYVIDAHGMDSSGEEILYASKLLHKKTESALGLLVNSASSSGYLKQESENVVLISYDHPHNNEKTENNYVKKLVRSCEEVAAELNIPTQIVTQSFGQEIKAQARENDVSPGKIVLLKKLQEVDQNATIEDIKEDSVKNIMSVIQNKENIAAIARETDKSQHDHDNQASAQETTKQNNSGNNSGNRGNNGNNKDKDKNNQGNNVDNNKDNHGNNSNNNDNDKQGNNGNNKDKDKDKDKHNGNNGNNNNDKDHQGNNGNNSGNQGNNGNNKDKAKDIDKDKGNQGNNGNNKDNQGNRGNNKENQGNNGNNKDKDKDKDKNNDKNNNGNNGNNKDNQGNNNRNRNEPGNSRSKKQ